MSESNGTPPPTSFLRSLRFIGPGLILTAGIVGTGELIVTPHLAAEHGFTLLWLIIVGCLVKVFVQVELARYAVATGTPTLQMMDQIPGPRFKVGWMVWFFIPVYFAMISVLGGMLGGMAQIFTMAGIPLSPQATAIIMGLTLAILLGVGRYKMVERVCIGLVVLFTLSTIFALVSLQFTDFQVSSAQIIEGLQFKLPDNFAVAFAALGLIGVGAGELIYYSYWCLEKGYAKRVGPQDAGWLDRVNGWMRVMKIDAFASLIVYTAATVVFYLLGAAVLHAQNLKVDNSEMVPTLGNMYLESFGPAGFSIFMVGAFATLYSTAFAASAANGRLLANLLPMFGIWTDSKDDEEVKAKRIKISCVAITLWGIGTYLIWPKPLTLILINGVGQSLLLPFLGICALYLRYRKLPAELRPGSLWTTCLWISALALASAGIYQLWDRF